jgi:hypothetical protein
MSRPDPSWVGTGCADLQGRMLWAASGLFCGCSLRTIALRRDPASKSGAPIGQEPDLNRARAPGR